MISLVIFIYQLSSLSQVVGRKVTWEQKKTNITKGDYWAPCPFHSEKTASFHVDDKKGFYYCFVNLRILLLFFECKDFITVL